MKNLLLLVLFSFPAWAQNAIRLHVVPPMLTLDWSTPRTIFITAFKNKWEEGSRPFGHVYTELLCDGQRIVTSTKAADFNPISEFLAGRGLGILYHTYEGDLEEGKKLEDELALRKKEGKILFVEYTLSRPHCERLLSYFQEYKSLKVARYYGLPHRPLYGEATAATISPANASLISSRLFACILSNLPMRSFLPEAAFKTVEPASRTPE